MAGETVSIEELVISSLATTDALAKLLIAKGITDEEFNAQLGTERMNYLPMLKRLRTRTGGPS